MVKDILFYAILVSTPAILSVILLFRIMNDFVHKMAPNKLIVYTVIVSLLDAISAKTLPINLQTPISTFITVLFIVLIFKLNPLNAMASYLVTFIPYVAVMTLSYFVFLTVGIDMNEHIGSLYYSSIFTFFCSIILLLITFTLCKINKPIKLFRKYELFSDEIFETFLKKHIIIINHILFTFFLVVTLSFSTLLSVKTGNLNPSYHFVFDIIVCLLFIYPYLNLTKQLNKYKDYEQLYKFAEQEIKNLKSMVNNK